MFESILNSKIKIRIAKLFSETNQSLQVSDVARRLKISKSRASECLSELSEKGILEKKVIGRSVVYKMASTGFAETIRKMLAQERVLLSEIKNSVLKEVKKLKPVSVVLYGSSLKGLKFDRDVDFLLIYKNDLEKEKIYEMVGKLSEKFGLHISILSMSEEEFRKKARAGEEFILNIMANHNLIYGKKLDGIVW